MIEAKSISFCLFRPKTWKTEAFDDPMMGLENLPEKIVGGLREKEKDTEIEAFCSTLDPFNRDFVELVLRELLLRQCWPQSRPLMQQFQDLGSF